MLLKQITYKDFRCFRGDITINLEGYNDKNIVVLLGDNTQGKSTFVQSFVWCFYGIANFQNPEIYNRAIAKELPAYGKTLPTVEVVFEHEKILYTARRVQEFIKSPEGAMIASGGASNSKFYMVYLDTATGQTKPCGFLSNELAKAINNILPKDLAPYFFFAGEKNNDLTTKSLSSAVRNLMGIEPLIRMRDHLRGDTKIISSKSVLGYYQEKQADTSNFAAKNEWDKKVKAEQELAKLDNDLTEITEQINAYEKKIDEINEILRNAQPTKLLQQKRDTIARNLKWEIENLEKLYNRFLSQFNENAVNILTIPLLTKARKILDQMDLSDKGIKGIEAPAIQQLLDRGYCLCGTELKEGTIAYKTVEKYFDILPPKSVGTLVNELLDKMTQSEYNGRSYVKNSLELYQDIQYSIQKIHDLEREEQDALEELKGIKQIPSDQYEADLKQYKQRLINLREEERTKIISRQSWISSRDTASNNYNELISKSKRNEIYALYYEYAQRILDWVNLEYNEKEQSLRTKLSEAVTTLFNNIYTGKRQVKIGADYNISIYPPADTDGIKAIQYFSYVGGLVKVTRQIMKERKEGETFGEEYPLVLDAAFSHTDTTHTKKIALELSKVTQQLIFAVMNKDWSHVGNEISENIARTYILDKLNEDEVTVREV